MPDQPRSQNESFPALTGPVFFSAGHTAHATDHTGIQRVTRSLARELQASGLKVELVEWVHRKRRFVILDDSAREKLSRDGGPPFESTDALWSRVMPEITLNLPQLDPSLAANLSQATSFGEDRIRRFEQQMQSIAHPIPNVPTWIRFLPLPRSARRGFRRAIRSWKNLLVRRNDRRRIRSYIRDIVSARRLQDRMTQQMIKLLERQRDCSFRLAWKERDAWRYKQIRDTLARAQDPQRPDLNPETESPADLPADDQAQSERRDLDLFALTLRLLPTRFNPPVGSWIIVPELMKAAEMKEVLRYCRRRNLNLGVVFHDAIAVTHPDLVNEAIRLDYADYMRSVCRSDLVLPVSRQSADDLAAFARDEGIGLPPIRVCANGASFPGDRPAGEQPMSVTPIKALCVGTIDPRKNHATLLSALSLIRETHPDLDLHLTLVGNAYPGADALAAEITRAGVRDPGLEWIQGADDTELDRLYRECAFTVFPSLVEGFGIPVLESIWYGRPCICSPDGAVGERALGGGCLTVDVASPQALAIAMADLARDADLRRRLTEEARSRSLRTWREQALDMVGIVAGEQGPFQPAH